MSIDQSPVPTPDWASTSGDIWARRWKDTDRGLSGLAPHLLGAIEAAAPPGAFKGFDIGCGPGSTTIDVAKACPEAEIVACDISEALGGIARHRLSANPRVRIVVGDAEAIAPCEAPLDVIYSRHGVMFFDDPARAFAAFRGSVAPRGSIVFSCFQGWELNPWAAEVAAAAAGRPLPPPGREPSGFAFADAGYVREILGASGWQRAEAQDVRFRYVAAEGPNAVDEALSFLAELGPAARVLEKLDAGGRNAALERMRVCIEGYVDGGAVAFPAAAWIWSASAA